MSLSFDIHLAGRLGSNGADAINIALPAEAVTPAELAAALMPVAQASEDAACAGTTVSCGPGCGACCRQLVTISPLEACIMNTRLEAQRAANYRERFDAIETRLDTVGLTRELLDLGNPALDEETHYQLARRYFELALPCPFLVDESCSIHPARPALCREYLVDSPAIRCRDPFAQSVTPLKTPLPVSQTLLHLSARLLGSERLWPIPLALAPRWAREHATFAQTPINARKALSLFETLLMVSD